MSKTGRPRGRPRKIRPEGSTSCQPPPVTKFAKVIGRNGKKRGRPMQTKTGEQEFMAKQKEEIEKLKLMPLAGNVGELNTTSPEICPKPNEPSSSSEQTKKFGKIPIVKFIPKVPKPSLQKLTLNDSSFSPFQPLTPPASDASRSNSEVSAYNSFSPSILPIPDEVYVPVSKFQLINAWLAQKQSNWCVKNSDCLRKMMNKEGLVSTFKCMAKACSYTTISRKNFETHIRWHESTLNQLDFLFFCPYCFFKGTSAENLISHYTSVHNYDKFQCGCCFYRSADAQTCWEHCIKFHLDLPPVVYECPLELAPNNEATKLSLQSNRRRFVSSLKCTSCSLTFYLIDPYEAHMSQHTASPDISDVVLNDLRTYRSKKENCQIGRYECLYCEYGTNQIVDFRSHMQEHPMKAVFACTRKNLLTEIDPHSIESAPIKELPKRAETKVIEFDQDLAKLKNSENVKNICG